jgi:type VI secretion system protein ImpE
VGLIPSRYPGSEASEDAQILMAHKTEWLNKTDGICWGLGQRLLATNIDDYALLDIREIQLNPSV